MAVREYDTIQFDTIDERRGEEPPKESAVERLASLVYSLLMAYIWLWILIAALMVVGVVVKLVF